MLLDVAVTVSAWLSPPPVAMPARFTVCTAAPSRIAAGSAIGSSVGASLTAVTVTVKVRENVVTPSPTVTVITADPFASATGV